MLPGDTTKYDRAHDTLVSRAEVMFPIPSFLDTDAELQKPEEGEVGDPD